MVGRGGVVMPTTIAVDGSGGGVIISISSLSLCHLSLNLGGVCLARRGRAIGILDGPDAT